MQAPQIALAQLAVLPGALKGHPDPHATALLSAARLKDWPGPLSDRGGNAKALHALATARATEAMQRRAVAVAVLWRLLGVMAQHKGCLVGGARSGKEAGASAAVVKVLHDAYGGARPVSSIRPGFAMAPAGCNEAVQAAEAALLNGDANAALQIALDAKVCYAALCSAACGGCA